MKCKQCQEHERHMRGVRRGLIAVLRVELARARAAKLKPRIRLLVRAINRNVALLRQAPDGKCRWML